MAKKNILCVLFFVFGIAQINSQNMNFGWSLGDFGWSYNFIGQYDIVDLNLLRFNFSFSEKNIMISTSLMSGTNKNNRNETEAFYNSFFPIEIIYTPFRWRHSQISVFGRGSWVIGYIGDVANPIVDSRGFFGSIGLRVGLFPIESNFFRYKSNMVNIFSEYTSQNQFKLGVSVDIWAIVYIGFRIWLLGFNDERNANNWY